MPRGRFEMLIELHCHTSEHSPCSTIGAGDLVRLVRSKGASGVVFTDHHYLWPDEEINDLRARLDVPGDFLILSGQEVFTKDFGDVLVYGASESITDRISLSTLRARCPDAALVWAHPYRYLRIPTEVELFDANLDGIEIINPHQMDVGNKRGVSDWESWGFTATSGTDIHHIDIQSFYPTTLERQITDIRDLADCIKAGLCTPYDYQNSSEGEKQQRELVMSVISQMQNPSPKAA